MWISDRKGREKGTEAIFEAIMMESFPKYRTPNHRFMKLKNIRQR